MPFVTIYTAIMISIHAPRGGSDNLDTQEYLKLNDFNPRSPWGERPGKKFGRISTPGISIHAPRGGSDKRYCIQCN